MIRLLAFGLLLLGSGLHARSSSPADSVGIVAIVTTPAGADVFLDSTYLGKSPVRGLEVPQGRHVLRAFYPSVFAWNPLHKLDTLDIAAGGRVERQLELGTSLRILSVPFGGGVTVERFPMGTTPLYLRSSVSGLRELGITKAGYDSVTVALKDGSNGLVRVRLTPTAGAVGFRSTGDPVSRVTGADHWSTYASASTMVVSGIASAYLKDQANKEFDRYLLTKDPGALSKTRNLDKGAAVTLIISQISFAILAYILLSE